MSDRRPNSAARLVLLGAVLGLVAAVGLGLVKFVNSGPLRYLELVGTLGLTLVYASPALLALLSLRGREVLLIPAIALGAVASVSAFSGVTLVLLVPTALWTVAYVRHLRSRHRPRVSNVLVGVLTVAVMVASFFVLFLSDDPVCWKVDSDGGVSRVADAGSGHELTIGGDENVVSAGCSSDAIVAWEGVLAAGMVGLGLIGAVALVGPTSRAVTRLS